ncbi:MAG: hypothetical protein QOD00_3398, partial [Blastocatellia bacterium]|nr:hypothetical protein [Blastocatellia bacterium]
MKIQTLWRVVGVVLLALGLSLAMMVTAQVRQGDSARQKDGGRAGEYKISGP